jgi:TonB family protein
MLDALPSIERPPDPKADKKPEPSPLDFDRYKIDCNRLVMAHFKPAKNLRKKQPGLQLELLIAVDLEGRVTGVGASQRSGNSGFDKAAIKALNKAGDFPPPPQGWDVAKDRVILTFRPR